MEGPGTAEQGGFKAAANLAAGLNAFPDSGDHRTGCTVAGGQHWHVVWAQRHITF